MGLIVPHAVRLIVGPDHRRLVPAAALAGAAFLVLADCLARTLLPQGEIPIGVVTALCGGPLFLMLLRNIRRPRGVDMLAIEKLSAGYGEKLALHDVTLTVAAGEFLGVLGPNGCGKTTLLRAMRAHSTAPGMRPAGRSRLADHRQAESRPNDGLPAAGPGDCVGFHRPRVGLDGPQPPPFAFRAGIGRRSPRGGGSHAVGRRIAPGRPAGHDPQRRRAAADVDRHVPGPAAEILLLDEPTNHLDLSTSCRFST